MLNFFVHLSGLQPVTDKQDIQTGHLPVYNCILYKNVVFMHEIDK